MCALQTGECLLQQIALAAQEQQVVNVMTVGDADGIQQEIQHEWSEYGMAEHAPIELGTAEQALW